MTLAIKEIVSGFSVTSQIQVEDLAGIAELGFRSLLNNRPDGEEEGQPTSDELAAEASRLGLEYLHVPVSLEPLTDQGLAGFVTDLRNLPEPVLGFCRTGNRAVRMWAQAKATDYRTAELLQIANTSGFDIVDLQQRLEALSAR